MDFLIHHLLRTSAERFPGREALVHGDQRLTYGDVFRLSSGLAQGLRDIGVRRGERVGIFLGMSVAQVISIFGISRAGAVYVPINELLFPAQVVHIVANSKMKVLITAKSRLGALLSALADVDSLEAVICISDAQLSPSAFRCHDFDEMTDAPVPAAWSEWSISRDLAAILYTSGSTGKPKGVMLSHANVIAGASIVSEYLEITDRERILAVLPLSFDAGMNQLTTAFQQGASLILLRFVFAREIVAALLRERITGLAGIPTLWRLLTRPGLGLLERSFPHLRYITNTGGAMPQESLSTLRRVLPDTKVYLMYGLTEAFRSTYLRPEEVDRRPTSIGKAIPDTEIFVVREDGTQCAPGELGELVHRGPTVSMGYWRDAETTKRVFRASPMAAIEDACDDRVCYSGDFVRMDSEGFLYFAGRRDAMIKSAGFRISPTEVEEVLFQSDLVYDVAVIGVVDNILGSAVKAFVVPEGETFDADTLVGFCGDKMPDYMVPKMIEFVSEIPKTSNGKADYAELRRRERR